MWKVNVSYKGVCISGEHPGRTVLRTEEFQVSNLVQYNLQNGLDDWGIECLENAIKWVELLKGVAYVNGSVKIEEYIKEL